MTKMQKLVKPEYSKYILGVLFPEFQDILDEFYINVGYQYTWVTIDAKRPTHYHGTDNRTKKERKYGVYYKPDTREIIEEGYHIYFGIDNHSQHEIWGRVTKQEMEYSFDCVKIKMWNFNSSYGAGKEFTQEQQDEVIKYLNDNGIGKPTLDEFYNEYYRG